MGNSGENPTSLSASMSERIDRANSQLGHRPTRKQVRFLVKLGGGYVVATLAPLSLLVANALAARQLGASDFGVFNVAYSIMTILAWTAPLGWPVATLRFVSEYLHRNEWGLLRGFLIRSVELVLFLSLVAALGLAILALILKLSVSLRMALLAAALFVPVIALRRQGCRTLMALDKPIVGIFLDDAAASILFVTLILFVRLRSAVEGILWLGLFSFLSTVPLFLYQYYNVRQRVRRVKSIFATRIWISMSLPAVLGSVTRVIMNRVDVLLLASLAGVTEVGLYSAASRLALVLNFIPQVTGSLLSAPIVKSYYANRPQHTRQIFFGGMAISIVLAAVPAIVLLAAPEFILRHIFGQQFGASSEVLRILVIGQLVNAATGPLGGVLTMTGREKIQGGTCLIACLFNIVVDIPAIELYGGKGAALGSMATAILLNLWQFVIVMRHLSPPPQSERPI